jgi:alpha-1,2-rhamnosyltransferase
MTTFYVECGTTLNSKYLTGIQRVVINILNQAEDVAGDLDVKFIPVTFDGKDFVIRGHHSNPLSGLKKFKYKIPKFIRVLFLPFGFITPYIVKLLQFILRPSSAKLTKEFLENSMESESVLLLLDSTWDTKIWVAVKKLKSKNFHISAVLYDLIPFSHPDTVEKNTLKAHTSYWKIAPLYVDSIVCISKSVRDDFLGWQESQPLKRKIDSKKVGYFYLGSDFPSDDPVIKVLNSNAPYFLVVGSIEPRKNHEIVINTFDKIWRSGKNVSLVIVGANNWSSSKLLRRIKSHSEYNKRLFLIQDASDRDLNSLYKSCTSLIMPSRAEGFGLPIVEAKAKGVPVICSDIPVFREVGGAWPIYFDLNKPKALQCSIFDILNSKNSQILLNSEKSSQKHFSWKDSTLMLIRTVISLL